MKRRFLLATLLCSAGASTASAADGFPYGSSLIFTAYRSGQMIGHHALRFREDGGKHLVSTSVDFDVRILGITLYRFNYRSHEIWSGDTFQSVEAETNDDGKKYSVHAQHSDAGLAVDIGAPPPALDQKVFPAGTLPSTHWNREQVRQSALLNTQSGKLSRIQVVPLGRETIKTATGTLEATRYDYTGDVVMSQWFDDRDRWVKSTFQASDNSTIEYVLQE
jgi:hypothetical protein